MVSSLRKLDQLLRHFEDGVLAALLGGMILLATLQIGLRNLADTGFIWADPLLRIMVLWLGLVGAVAATRDDRHINIDLLSRFATGRWQAATKMLTDLFAAFICGVVAWNSYLFVVGEAEYGLTGIADVPVWIFQSIIPAAFALMTLRFAVHALMQLEGVIRGEHKT